MSSATESSENFNAERDAPDLLPIADKAIRENRGLLNLAVTTRLGLTSPAEQVQVEQMLEMSNNLVEHSNKMMEKIDTILEQTQKTLHKLDNKIEVAQDKIEKAKEKSLPMAYKVGSVLGIAIGFLSGILF